MQLNNDTSKQHDSFAIWSVSRNDLAMAFADDNDIEPDWPYDLSDQQMEAVARRMQDCLSYDMDIFWDTARGAALDVLPEAQGVAS